MNVQTDEQELALQLISVSIASVLLALFNLFKLIRLLLRFVAQSSNVLCHKQQASELFEDNLDLLIMSFD